MVSKQEELLFPKAKRRIKKFLATGEHQPRVYPTDDPTIIEYRIKHHFCSWLFKVDSLGRLRLKEVRNVV
jgi:hypothetical protein